MPPRHSPPTTTTTTTSTTTTTTTTTKAWIVIGITVAGALILAETTRRLRRKSRHQKIKDFGAFIERLHIPPSPQPPPPAAPLSLAGLSFAVSDNVEVKGFVAGFGNPDWARTHEAAGRTAVAVGLLLKNGATCVGRTVMDELGYGVSGENLHYGTPVNRELPSQIPGGSCSGSAVAVATELVDFAIGTDTAGCVRIPASFCGIFGFRPSHGTVSTIGVLTNSQSLDTIGLFTRDPSTLHRVGNTLFQATVVGVRRSRRIIFADDCFQFSRVPKQRSVHVIHKAIEPLTGYQPPKHMNLGQYIASNVPSLKEFRDHSSKMQQGVHTLKALSTVMLSLQRYEFKVNHEEWMNNVQPRIGLDNSSRVLEAVNSSHENIKGYYKVRTELRAALNSLLKDDGILVIPTTPDLSLIRKSKKKLSPEFEDQLFPLLGISGISGCCQVAVPLGKHDHFPISVSLIAAHGADKFLLDTVLDIHSAVQEQIMVAMNSKPVPEVKDNMDVSELLKEKGNAAYNGKQWNKAINFYSEAIKLTETNATYYCNRAAAYLELGGFREAEADCNQAILLDNKNVKAYLRRGTAREMLLLYKEAAQDFKHASVLEPQNKVALEAEKRLRKLTA